MSSLARSPLAPEAFPALGIVGGVQLGVALTGLRYKGRNDLLLALLPPATAVAGVLTRSRCPSAPVDWCRKLLARGVARALVVNAGNANAFTGRRGIATVEAVTQGIATALGIDAQDIFVASTGVIGQALDPEPVIAAALRAAEHTVPAAWEPAAEAIMTTDTYAKGAGRRTEIAGRAVTISGIAKGSGMIAPDMATMLSFVFTDAAIAPSALQVLLREATDASFNCITVDGDTSTSDTLLLFATGAAGNEPILDPEDPRLHDFRLALAEVTRDLAQQVVRDGEGATKFVTVDVTGARSDAAARRCGLAIANSPLVKTAIAGEDANWGRVVMAVGKSGEEADRDRLKIAMGGTVIAAEGEAVEGYDEAPVTAHMQGRDVHIAVDLGIGSGSATVWTCDLTHGYIDINGSYRS